MNCSSSCGCKFYGNCLTHYVTNTINKNCGVASITCPDAERPKKSATPNAPPTSNLISRSQIESLVSSETLEQYKKLLLDIEVGKDPNK